MAKKKKALTRTFVRWAVLLSTLSMAVLVLLGLLYLRNRPQILQKRAEAALESGSYDKAIAALSELEQTEQTAEMLLAARYEAAAKLLLDGKYEEAETAFAGLGDYKDARTQILACRYGLAELAYQNGDYEDARAKFYALSGYKDVLTRYNDCRYAIALQAEAADPEKAFALFRELGGFSDAPAQAERIAMQLTGMTDPENAVNRMLGVSEEEILVQDRIKAVRDALPQHALAVGFYHTVGLRQDGTVVAAGRNTDGQCNVTDWSGIVAIDCGAYHTVGLKADGTVVAVGRNEEGQCDVAEWGDIVEIVCTDYDTVGLKRDGTVVRTGYHAYAELLGWSDIVTIGGGSYAAVAVTEAGQLLSSHPSSRSESIVGAIAVDASTGYTLALLPNGTLLYTDGETGISDAVAISATSTGFMALSETGKVYTHWFRERDAIDFSDLETAVAIAAGGTHSAVLLSDGTVIARGLSDDGECATESWNLGAKAQ